jgi:hypothetical protein
MVDPVSIISNAVSIADVLVRLGRYLKEVYDDASMIDDYILGLLDETEQLNTIVSSIQETFKAQSDTSTYLIASDPDSVASLWEQLGKSLSSCLGGVRKMEIVVMEICGKYSKGNMLDSLAKAHRKRSKADSLRQCRDQLATYQRSLQIVLATIVLYVLPLLLQF